MPTANNSLAKKEETPRAEPAKYQMVLVYAYHQSVLVDLLVKPVADFVKAARARADKNACGCATENGVPAWS